MEMPNTSTAPPLGAALCFCPLCDNLSLKTGPQYKRHTAYCSKSKDRTRLRSYRVCSAAKIKYNYCAPCQQCVRRGVRCVYDL
ncbi:hypothetical protein BGZ57DRAFT_134057 [Hyaloscypha finlandica]|nr:hypothetical protein BGZ57DRAFT_134057 [Hyaloscypha finlandica]